MKRIALCLTLLLAIAPVHPLAQEPVTSRVDANSKIGSLKPIWAYVGYDEPNYTYMKHGQKLVAELAKMNSVPVYFRAHSLLVSGDGKPALKWGSTNAYTEDASGKPIYDWKIIDQIFDTYIKAGAKPLVEIGFMPEALSVKPQPYRHYWEPGKPYAEIYTGWAYPPKDYAKWAELIRQWVLHSVERYGKEEVLTWYWELWNEPDITYWKGTPEEYNKLYDYTGDAIKRALPQARVGGPATTGPSSQRASAFLRQFLEHCARGKNYVTGQTGAPLDFITYHAKGNPRVVEGYVQMGLMKNLADIDNGLKIIAILKEGVRGKPDIDALAARAEREVMVMAWNYHDNDLPAPDSPVRLTISGVPITAQRVLVRHYRIDRNHSNAYTVWKEMGSPQNPTPEQYARLEAAGQLQLLTSPEWVSSKDGKVELSFALPRQAVSLIQVSW